MEVALPESQANMSDAADACSINVENVFGPIVVNSCLKGFDFTLLFEESILTILPLAIASKSSPAALPYSVGLKNRSTVGYSACLLPLE